MTDKQLRRFLSVMVDNLVDSNVFMRSLVLSVEHSAFRIQTSWAGEQGALQAPSSGAGRSPAASSSRWRRRRRTDAEQEGYDEPPTEENEVGFQGLGDGEEPCYLGHTWFDVQLEEVNLTPEVDAQSEVGDEGSDSEGGEVWAEARDTIERDDEAVEDSTGEQKVAWSGGEWGGGEATGAGVEHGVEESKSSDVGELGGEEKVERHEEYSIGEGPQEEGDAEGDEDEYGVPALAFVPVSRRGLWGASADVSKLTRLQAFLKQNTPQLVRDLMGVVNLETINHENICCLNTAVLILIFADRRGHLAEVGAVTFCVLSGRKLLGR